MFIEKSPNGDFFFICVEDLIVQHLCRVEELKTTAGHFDRLTHHSLFLLDSPAFIGITYDSCGKEQLVLEI